jgi:hypothetical protein
MSEDSVRQMVLAELRTLRREYGLLDAAKLTSARAIVKGFGGDGPDVALQRLVDLAHEYGDDRDIEAALAGLGWGVSQPAALDRLSEFALRYHVDARTVRRWSDQGFQKLALLIVGKAPWIQLRARQVLSIDGREVRLGLDLRIPANLRMGTPKLWIDDRPIEIGMPEIATSPDEQRIRSALDAIGTLDDLPIRVRLMWSGQKYPIYEAVAHGTREVYSNSRIVFLSLHTTISRARDTED